MISLQSQHEPREDPDDQDDRQADGSLLMECPDDSAADPSGMQHGTERPSGEQGEIAESGNHLQSLSSD
jgi:hypothetical protein